MGIVYFLLTKFADMFFGNQPESDYEMMGVMEDVYDYEDYDYGNDYDYDYDFTNNYGNHYGNDYDFTNHYGNHYGNDYDYDFSDDRWFYGYLV